VEQPRNLPVQALVPRALTPLALIRPIAIIPKRSVFLIRQVRGSPIGPIIIQPVIESSGLNTSRRLLSRPPNRYFLPRTSYVRRNHSCFPLDLMKPEKCFRLIFDSVLRQPADRR
jgi:hypothetical protein